MIKTTLYRANFIHVVKLNGWFEAVEHANCKNNISVAVLPYRLRKTGIEFLSRFELNPAHLQSDFIHCADTPHQVSIITGACETGNSLYHAKHELLEEGGYDISESRFKYVGHVAPAKSSCTTMHLYVVRIISSDRRCLYAGDGTQNEKREFSEWVTRDVMIAAKDPYIHTIILREGL